MAVTAHTSARFAETGYLGPLRVLTRAECRRFLRAVDLRVEPPLDWDKGRAAASRAYYEVATRPEILDRVSQPHRAADNSVARRLDYA